LPGLEISGDGSVRVDRGAFRVDVTAAIVLVAGTACTCCARSPPRRAEAFTVQLLFLHRYLFVLAGEALRMSAARDLRAGDHPRGSAVCVAAGASVAAVRGPGASTQRCRARLRRRAAAGRLDALAAIDTLFVGLWCVFFVAIRLVDVPHAMALVAGGMA
jgi:cobalt/nickel transport system permease protein